MSITQPQPDANAGPGAGAAPEPKVWIDGRLVPRSEAVVSVYDHGFLYGDGCFEGIRAYGGRIFKLRSHLERMHASAAMIRLEPAWSLDEIDAAVRETVAANGLRDAYIRLVYSRGAGTLGLNPFLCPKPCTVIIADRIQLYPQELYDEGMPIITARRPRIPIACLDPAIKSLNYLNNILAKTEAIDAGVLEALMLNVEGFVSECTGDNVFAMIGGTLVTPPTGAGILHGITRRFVMDELAPAAGIPVEERLFRREDLVAADEVFLTGTAAEIIGVTRIDDDVIGDGGVGPVTRDLTARFRAIVAEDAPED